MAKPFATRLHGVGSGGAPAAGLARRGGPGGADAGRRLDRSRQAVGPGPIGEAERGQGVGGGTATFPCFQPERLDAAAPCGLGRPAARSFALVVAYGQILRDDFIARPRLGTLNLHASLLPRYRGRLADPDGGRLRRNGDRNVSHADRSRARRRAGGRCGTGCDRAARYRGGRGGQAGRRRRAPSGAHAARLLAGRTFLSQNRPRARPICRRLERADGVLDFSRPAATLAARVNGLHPWPSVTVEISGTPVRVGLADAIEGSGSAGAVVGADANGLLVGTGSGTPSPTPDAAPGRTHAGWSGIPPRLHGPCGHRSAVAAHAGACRAPTVPALNAIHMPLVFERAFANSRADAWPVRFPPSCACVRHHCRCDGVQPAGPVRTGRHAGGRPWALPAPE